jgi:hypothetical protein
MGSGFCSARSIFTGGEMEQQKNTVTTMDGKVIDRAEAAFHLYQHKEDPTLFIAFDGTVYQKTASGAMKRLTHKKHERKRRAE